MLQLTWPRQKPLLGPDNSPSTCFSFFAFKDVLKYLFLQRFFNINQKLAKKVEFCKTQAIRKTFCCNPQLHQTLVFHKLSFLKDKTSMWTKNTTWDKEKTKIRKGSEKQNKTGNQKTTEMIDEKLSNQIVWCCCFHETNAKRQGKKEKQKTRKHKRKKENKEGRKKEKNKRVTEKERVKRGSEKARDKREKRRETL